MTGATPEQVHEHNGHLWKPKPGATSTFEEMLAARATYLEIYQDARWNPWVEEDRAADREHAMEVAEQWTRAEPGFRYMTDEELEERFAQIDERAAAERAADEARWERDRQRYDPEREAARLSWLEQSSILERERQELAEYRSGQRYPGMASDKRTAEMAALETSIAERVSSVARLSERVGNPEDVVDERGRLPRDRREVTLMYYDIYRKRDVKDLRQRLPELRAALKASTDRAEKSKLRADIQTAECKMADLLAVPPLTADDMCSECATPANKHGWVTPPYKGPCPAWPGWSARIRETLRMLEQSAARSRPAEPEPPKPQPLATVPSGLPIGEVAKRLNELETEFPGAVVKRGRANRWEVWPAD